MGRVDFKLDDVELKANVAEFPAKVNKYLTLTTDFAKGKGVDQMKLKAPWTDRTSAARNGLNGNTEHLGQGSGPAGGFSEHRITFAHGVDYGIWLEIANSGKFQIIMPTVVAIGKAVMKTIGDAFQDLDRPVPNVRAEVPMPFHQGTSQGATTRTERETRRAKRTAKGGATNTTPRTRRT